MTHWGKRMRTKRTRKVERRCERGGGSNRRNGRKRERGKVQKELYSLGSSVPRPSPHPNSSHHRCIPTSHLGLPDPTGRSRRFSLPTHHSPHLMDSLLSLSGPGSPGSWPSCDLSASFQQTSLLKSAAVHFCSRSHRP